nr:hypothetical protein [Tanacetum cinerariifolium]
MSSAMPSGRVVDRSASSRIICVGVSSGKESFLQIERGIKLMLALRSARAKHSSNSGKSHGMRNLPGSPNFSGNFLKITVEQFSFTRVVAKSNKFSLLLRRLLNIKALEKRQAHQLELEFRPPESTSLEGGGETEGPAKVTPLRVVIALRSARGLGTVLLGSEPEPKDEAVFIWK